MEFRKRFRRKRSALFKSGQSILLIWYRNLYTNFRSLTLKVKTAPSRLKHVKSILFASTSWPMSPPTACSKAMQQVWFGLVSLFNGISTFVGYLMPKLFF